MSRWQRLVSWEVILELLLDGKCILRKVAISPIRVFGACDVLKNLIGPDAL
jgi:hypothetical protein